MSKSKTTLSQQSAEKSTKKAWQEDNMCPAVLANGRFTKWIASIPRLFSRGLRPESRRVVVLAEPGKRSQDGGRQAVSQGDRGARRHRVRHG